MSKKSKKESNVSQYIMLAGFVGIGAVGGFLAISCLPAQGSLWE